MGWIVGSFGAFGWPFGIIEIISVPTVIGLTIDYALHITHAFIHSPFPDRARRSQSALNDLGSSIFISAMTTILSMVILYFATILIFSDLGWVVASTTMFGVALSLFVCPPCLMLIGPQYDQCHFTAFCILFGGKCKKYRKGITIKGHTFCKNKWFGKEEKDINGFRDYDEDDENFWNKIKMKLLQNKNEESVELQVQRKSLQRIMSESEKTPKSIKSDDYKEEEMEENDADYFEDIDDEIEKQIVMSMDEEDEDALDHEVMDTEHANHQFDDEYYDDEEFTTIEATTDFNIKQTSFIE